VLVLLLVILGTAALTLSGVESNISHNDLWSEGVFQAAEAGIFFGIDRLGPDTDAATQPIADTLVTPDYRYRSGARFASAPEPLVFVGKQHQAGYALGSGTGYNPSGYAFARYRINATGIGPRESRREVEALAVYGPVAE
jgi:hypothetical protein